MKSVITQPPGRVEASPTGTDDAATAASSPESTVRRAKGAVLVISDDPGIVAQTASARLARGSGPVLIWNPEALAGPESNCAWDLLGAIVSAPDADRIANQLLSTVLHSRLASFFVPEAALLLANMLLAAAKSDLAFADVHRWVGGENAETAGDLLHTCGEVEAFEDVQAFLDQDPTTRVAVWETTQTALRVVDCESAVAAISPTPEQPAFAGAPFTALRMGAGIALDGVPTVYVLRSSRSDFRGLTSALVEELLHAAAQQAAATTVLHLDTCGGDGGDI